MNIIHILNKKAMTLIAGLAIVGFSSFKMIENLDTNSGAVTKWYPVAANGQTIDTLNPQDNPPTGSECQAANTGSTCFIKMTTTGAVPNSVADAKSDTSVSGIQEYHRL